MEWSALDHCRSLALCLLNDSHTFCSTRNGKIKAKKNTSQTHSSADEGGSVSGDRHRGIQIPGAFMTHPPTQPRTELKKKTAPFFVTLTSFSRVSEELITEARPNATLSRWRSRKWVQNPSRRRRWQSCHSSSDSFQYFFFLPLVPSVAQVAKRIEKKEGNVLNQGDDRVC